MSIVEYLRASLDFKHINRYEIHLESFSNYAIAPTKLEWY